MQMIGTRLKYFPIKSYSMSKSAMFMVGKVCKNSYFSFLNVLFFQEGLNLLGFFNFLFLYIAFF